MIDRRNALAAGLSLACSPWMGAAQAAPAVAMRAVTADDFRRSGMRGVGYGQLAFGPRSPAEIDAVASLGAGHVRVFVGAERDGDNYRILPKHLAALDGLLDNLARRGIYLVLAASFGKDARFAGLWNSDKLQDSVVDFWRQLAEHLQGRAVVAGFDLMNEPVPPGRNFAEREDNWLKLAERLVTTIRKADPQRVCIVESAPDATPETFDNMRTLPFDNLVYSVHSYRPMPFTHQTVMREYGTPQGYPDKVPGPEGRDQPGNEILKESLQHTKRFADKYNVPIYVGEFSAVRWAPGGSAARYVKDSIDLFNQYGWSWSYHEFRGWAGWDPEMDSPSHDFVPRKTDAPIVSVLRAGLRAGR